MPEPELVHSASTTLASNAPIEAAPSTDLLKDPFLLDDTQRSKPTTNAPRSTAMPWLEEAIAPTPKLESEDLEEPAHGSEVSQDQVNQPLEKPPQLVQNEDTNPDQDEALLEFTEDRQPSQQDPMDLLRDSWIRITVDPSLLNTTKGEAEAPPSWRQRLSRLFSAQTAAERRRRVRPAGISGSGSAFFSATAVTAAAGSATGAGVAAGAADGVFRTGAGVLRRPPPPPEPALRRPRGAGRSSGSASARPL